MRAEIAKLHDRLGATIIYVTHDQTEATTLGIRIVVMKDGSVQKAASLTVLYNKPDNIFVAGFIGSPQMKFINAKAELLCKLTAPFDTKITVFELLGYSPHNYSPNEPITILKTRFIRENYPDIIGIGGEVKYSNFQDAELLADISDYNKDIFDAHGWKIPESWPEFMKLGSLLR